jgi:GDPmannose 4,6-dehydratase
MTRRALITGITGQDGAYLAQLLLSRGYEVHGMVRRTSTGNRDRIEPFSDQLRLHEADLLDQLSLVRLVEAVRPHELYNLAAQSFVPASFSQPVMTSEFTALGVTRLLEAVRTVDPSIRFYQASSSEMFGSAPSEPQDEQTPLAPRNPYGVAKAYGHWMTANYREAYHLFAASGILFNHESPLRGPEFVTRHITMGVARIKHGLADKLELGNLDAQRDWGYAVDYVEAMWLMLQQSEPDDFVIATGEKHSVRQFAELAFSYAGLDWQDHVRVNPERLRPIDINTLCGNAAKARRVLGWAPKVSFPELVAMMVQADLDRVRADLT